MNNLINQKFGRWTVIRGAGRAKCGSILWLCLCKCGNKKSIVGYALKKGTTNSCGCLQKEMLSTRRTTHGHTKNHKSSKTYATWRGLIGRCINFKDKNYHYYGGRGIKVNKRWMKFPNFLKDMGNPPSNKHMIDRIDNDGNYCKSNCRWTTIDESNRNKRGVLIITHNNVTQCAAEWAREKNLNYKTLNWRLSHGWSIEKALTTPIRKKRNN